MKQVDFVYPSPTSATDWTPRLVVSPSSLSVHDLCIVMSDRLSVEPPDIAVVSMDYLQHTRHTLTASDLEVYGF